MNRAQGRFSTFANVARTFARERGDAPALTFEGRTLTFAELHAASSRAANALRARGVGPGDRVAVLSRNRAEFFELLVACSKIGAIMAGLNWRLAAGEIAEIVADCAPSLVVAGEEERALLPDSGPPVILFGAEYDAWRDAAPADDPGHEGRPDEVVLLLYTSGTTGLPKGVALSNGNMAFTRRLAEAWGMGPESVNLVAMPMFHIGGCGYGSSTFMAGGHTVLMREVDPAKAVGLVAEHGVTHTFLVPTVIRALLDVPGIEEADLSSLELLMYGAAPIGDVLLGRALAVLDCGFMHAYGMTEAAGTVTVLAPHEHLAGERQADRLRSVGRPLPWVELRIVDPKTGTDAERGLPGEIRLRSGMIMAGYWNKPDETREAVDAEGWYRTGDAAYLDADGYVVLFDRFKDMIISGGENIYPAEIENVLNAHAAVKEAGVIGVPHEKWGETPLAVVVAREALEPEAVIAFTRERLAHYKCPTRVVFADTLPRNASGKLLKHELRRQYGEA